MTIKWFKSPYNWVISPLTQPQVANQQQQKKRISNLLSTIISTCLRSIYKFQGISKQPS